MKRILSIMLAILLLPLCGCQQEFVGGLSILTENQQEYTYQWNSFYYAPLMNLSEEASIRLSGGAALHWDGSEYHISDTDGTRSYDYLLYLPYVEETEGGWYYRNEYVLTDIQNLTSEEFQATGSGEVVYTDSAFCESAAIFGDTPDDVIRMVQRRIDGSILVDYQPDSVFERTISSYTENREERICRWSYSGELLCEIHVEGYAECFAELENGGFLATLHNYANNTYQVICYNSDGSIHWTVPLGDTNPPCVFQFLICGDGIYGFGHVDREDRTSDLYVCHISMDGTLLNARTLGGTDFDSFDWAEESDGVFTVYGDTQSGNGDLPLSEDGHRVEFVLQLTHSLEILSATKEDHDFYHSDVRGYLNQEPILWTNPILEISAKDTLPTDNIRSIAVFEYEGGYVVLRNYEFGAYPYQYPIMSYQPSYRQMIATGYDANRNPLWQTVSEPFVS